MKRRPIPLEFEKPDHSDRNSLALHDAAIKSATTLMAVMNDVLKSPHLSAHFYSRHPGERYSMHGRPRSRTAPSTPVYEARGVEPVELPGSVPVWPKSHNDTRCPVDADSSKHAVLGCAIERPHSSPQLSSHAFQNDGRQPALASSRSASCVRQIAGQATPNRRCSASLDGQSCCSGVASLAPGSVIAPAPNCALYGSPYTQSTGTRGGDISSDGRGSIDDRLEGNPGCKTPTHDDFPQQMNLKALLERVSAMRKSHDAQIVSLKEEVESHKTYIAFLESCLTTAVSSQEMSKPGLTLDTSRIIGKTSSLSSTDVSASTSLQSLESTLEEPRRASLESAAAEAEALRRKLSLCRKTQSELGDVRRERDHFRDTIDRSERRIGQLKDLMRKSKDKDVAMRNKIEALEAALLAANTQRVDVLEGYREACEQMRRLHDSQLAVIRERDSALARIQTSESVRAPTSKVMLDTCSEDIRAQQITPFQQPQELQRLISEKDLRIRGLETEIQDRVSRSEIRKLEKRLKDTEAVRDQYNALLHTELRRQTKSRALVVDLFTPQVKSEAAAMVAEKLNSRPGTEIPERRYENLEKELTHCLSEIVLYKLDIRGYRKDLKEANAKIEDLQQSRQHRPGTPDSIDNRLGDESTTSGRRCSASSGLGLGIMQHSSMPTRPTVNSGPAAQRPRAMTRPSSNVSSLPELDKRLPKPPVVSQDRGSNPVSLLPTRDLTRTETVRSLSESIISSYAKRTTPEQDHGHVPPLLRGHSSDTPRSGVRVDSDRAVEATAVPISKYTPDMLRTPTFKMATRT